jgi:hypothetical protein
LDDERCDAMRVVSLLLWLLSATPSRGQEGLTYSPKILFVDNYQSLFFSIAEENCARGFQSMYQNLAVLDVWSSIKEDNPCRLCQDQNKNSHCCQTYDAASGVCACSTSRTGLGRMLRMCDLMKGRFAHIHGSFTGMYGDDYTYVAHNHTVTCVPEPYLSCSYKGVMQLLKAFAQQCADGNSRVHPDARCTFEIRDFKMRDDEQPELGLRELKATSVAARLAAPAALYALLLPAWAALVALQLAGTWAGGG